MEAPLPGLDRIRREREQRARKRGSAMTESDDGNVSARK